MFLNISEFFLNFYDFFLNLPSAKPRNVQDTRRKTNVPTAKRRYQPQNSAKGNFDGFGVRKMEKCQKIHTAKRRYQRQNGAKNTNLAAAAAAAAAA